MKAYISMLAIILCIPVFGEVGEWPPQSFRLQSTGGLIEDDFDYAMDPIDIRMVDGHRLYTNLANLLTYDELILTQNTYSKYLLAYAGEMLPIKGVKTFILVEKEGSKVAAPVKIFDWQPYELSGYGLIAGDYMDWQGEDYDWWYEREENHSYENGDVVMVNNFYDMGKLKVGARVCYIGNEYRQTTASRELEYAGIEVGKPTYEYVHRHYEHVVEGVTDTTYEVGDFNTLGNCRTWEFTLVFAYVPDNDMEYRWDIRVVDFVDKKAIDERYEYFFDNYPHTDSFVDNRSITEVVTGVESHDEADIELAGRLRRYLNNGYFEASVGMTTIRGGVNVDVVDGFTKHTRWRHFYSPDDSLVVEQLWYDSTYDVSIGNGVGLGFRVGGRMVIDFNKLTFGMGAYFTYSRYTENVQEKPFIRHIYSYEDHDFTMYDDYTREETITEGIKQKVEQHTSTYTLPVGIEYRFGSNDRFRLRMGVIATFNNSTLKTVTSTVTPKTKKVHIDYKDPRRADTTWTEKYDYHGRIETETASYSQQVRYMYGFGWQLTDNIQVDFVRFLEGDGGLLDLTTYRNLRLSITVRF